MSERDNVEVRAIPFTAEGFVGAGQSIQYMTGPIPQLDTVQVDAFHGNAYIGRSDTGEYISDSVAALRALILAVKNGEADHLL